MVRTEVFQFNGKYTFKILFCLHQVTQFVMYKGQVLVTRYDINMFRVAFFQINGKCTFKILFCLLQVTQRAVH